MRKALLTALATVLLLNTANARKGEFGINLGANYNVSSNSSEFGGAIMMKGAYNIGKHLQVGLSAELLQLHTQHTFQIFPAWDIAPMMQRPAEVITQNYWTGKAFVNARKQFGQVMAYGGVSGGYAMPTFDPLLSHYNDVNAGGWVAGVQMGATWFAAKNVGINVEYAPTFYRIRPAMFYIYENYERQNVFAFPFTVGVRFKI